MKVAIVDDHPVFRRGLVGVLREAKELEVVADVGSAAEALDLADRMSLDIAIVDVMMPKVSGITLTSELTERHPQLRVIGLSAIDEPAVIADMLRVGASGFALKTQPSDEIIEAIRHVIAGARYLPPTVSRELVEAALSEIPDRPFERLTPRERDVFELVILGLSNDEIATRLFISSRTAESHRHRVMRKLSRYSIPQLQRFAAVYGLRPE